MSVLPGVATGGLLEREAELARVARVFDRVGAAAGAVVVVEGPAGIGKSELLMAVGRGAQARGFGVLAARCSEFEEEIAFGVARQVFEPMLRAASSGERRRLLAGVAQVGARALGAAAGEPPADRFAAIHGLYWLCANRAERGPLVVSVDDVHWIDDPSLAWLGYLARRAGDLPLLLVVGLRSGDPGAERAELARIVRDSGAEQITLAPLSAAAVGAIVRTELDPDAEEPFCATCRELTGGNPLLLRELLAGAREEGLAACSENVPALHLIAPAAVGTSVLGRLGPLGAEAVALARAVAVLGVGAEVMLAARLAELDPAVAELTADRLASAQILAPTRPLEFFHPLIGAAVLEDIAPGARRIAHRKAAALIDAQGQGSLARVAAHLLACGPGGGAWVVGRLADAARETLDRGAPEVAVDYLRRALTEPPAAHERTALLLLLGIAEWRAGKPDAIVHLEQALAAAGDDHGALIAACSALAPAYNVTDQAKRAVEVLTRGLAAVGESDARLALTGEAAIAMVGMANERTAPAALHRARTLHGRLRTVADPPPHLLVMSASYAARGNRAAEAQELAERALACDPYPPPIEICNVLVFVLRLVECSDTLQRLCEDLSAAARRRGAVQELVGVSLFRASASCDCGALADAEADARWALERADGVHQMHAVSEVIRVLVERDELDEAEGALGQCVHPPASHSIRVVPFLIARGRLRAAQGRPQDALRDFLECGQRCEPFGSVRQAPCHGGPRPRWHMPRSAGKRKLGGAQASSLSWRARSGARGRWASRCVRAAWLRAASSPGAPSRTHVYQGGSLGGVACPSVSQCTAVDSAGEEVTFDPRAPGASTPASIAGGGGLSGVACPSVSQCTAIDIDGNARTFNPSAPSDGISGAAGDPGLAGIVCPSTSQCLIVGGGLSEGDPATLGSWVGTRIAGASTLSGVACSPTAQCVVVDRQGAGFVSSGTIGGLRARPTSYIPPTISGKARVGRRLSASPGTWVGTWPISYTYQWQRCAPGCMTISGATTSTHTVTAADTGRRLRVVVTASNSVGGTQAASREVGPVIPTASQVRPALQTVLRPAGRRARIGPLLKHGGYAFSFTPPSVGRLYIAWYLVPKGAHLSKAKKPVLVARLTVVFKTLRRAKVKIRLTANGRGILRSAMHVKLTAKGTFTPTGYPGTSTTRTFTLNR